MENVNIFIIHRKMEDGRRVSSRLILDQMFNVVSEEEIGDTIKDVLEYEEEQRQLDLLKSLHDERNKQRSQLLIKHIDQDPDTMVAMAKELAINDVLIKTTDEVAVTRQKTNDFFAGEPCQFNGCEE
jgi:hypothetical protein